MKVEIRSAATFLSNLLKLANAMEDKRLSQFCSKVEDLLNIHYQQHWFPEKPCKGSGYRCIRINHKMDPIIAKAGFACGVNEASLRQMFPNELTLWVDPKEVSYRIGENGSICVLFDGSKSQAVKNGSSVTDNDTHQRRLQSSRTAKITYYHRNNGVNQHHGSISSYEAKKSSSCKDSVRWNDCFIMDPTRNPHGHLEQFVSFASSAAAAS